MNAAGLNGFLIAGVFVVLAVALTGVRQVRRGEVAKHKRSMALAGILVAAFLVSFLVKSAFLGREDFALWSAFHVNNLRVHETFVLFMLVAALVAVNRARRMKDSYNVTRDRSAAPAPEEVVRWHRRAGWTAIVCGGFGFATAVVVLAGMIGRAG